MQLHLVRVRDFTTMLLGCWKICHISEIRKAINPTIIPKIINANVHLADITLRCEPQPKESGQIIDFPTPKLLIRHWPQHGTIPHQ